jgi:subtilase family protein
VSSRSASIRLRLSVIGCTSVRRLRRDRPSIRKAGTTTGTYICRVGRVTTFVAAALSLLTLAGSTQAAEQTRTRPRPPVGLPRQPASLTESQIEGLGKASPETQVIVSVAPGSAHKLLTEGGARPLSERFGNWVVSTTRAVRLVRALQDRGLLRRAYLDARLRLRFPALVRTAADPLWPYEWWIPAIRADGLTPPAFPGVPVVVIDDGVDTTQPEFAQRPSLFTLNAQQTNPPDDSHGTAVASVVGAPTNGSGVSGLYPSASLGTWDLGGMMCSDALAGLAAASNPSGAGVINTSWGFFDFSKSCPDLYDAVMRAFGSGKLIVAAAGNDREQGSPPIYPGAFPHVLTIAATDRSNQVAGFSSRGPSIDLAAPGVDIPVAVPTWESPFGYEQWSGTSFSSPIVAAAASWLWTLRGSSSDVTQIAALLRRAGSGFEHNDDTGFGLLDMTRAMSLLSQPPPVAADPTEPNDDIYQIVGGGLFSNSTPSLTSPRKSSARFYALMDPYEDPVDVYRAWIPPRRTLAVQISEMWGRNFDLAIFNSTATTVFGDNPRGYIGGSYRLGGLTDRVTVANRGLRGKYVFICAFDPGDSNPHHLPTTRYRLRVQTLR